MPGPAISENGDGTRRTASLLAPEANEAADYRELAASVASSSRGYDFDSLRATLSDVRRRAVAEPQSTDDDGLQEAKAALAELEAAVQQALAEHRIAAATARITEVEQRQPLRRRILERLARSPTASTQLARDVDADRASVSRMLATLAGEVLVFADGDPDDQRRRIYALTSSGAATLNRHYALGERTPPPEAPSAGSVAGFLRQALDAAVYLRRHANRLDDAAERMGVIVREARKISAADLELMARRELLTTLRQAENEDLLADQLEELGHIAAGRNSAFGSDLVLPAYAHLEYERGRLPEEVGGSDLFKRAEHLRGAGNAFAQLRGTRSGVDNWAARQAWALVSLADNYRQQTEFERALEAADDALSLFLELDDPHGRSRSLFMIGFCMRLRGQFDEAERALTDALALAEQHEFPRFQVDALMQLGEVHRCLGNYDDARARLTRADEHAERLTMTTTRAFARSALGATEFQRGFTARARSLLESAHRLFAKRKHAEGQALNLRRQAIVARAALASYDAALSRREANDLLAKSQERYRRLSSPAGEVACVIEAGQLRLATRQDPSVECDRLLSVIARPSDRHLLALDPWVPVMLTHFAKAADDQRLDRAAAALLEDAKLRCAEQVEFCWHYGDAAAVLLDCGAAREHFDEMAGEPRRRRVPRSSGELTTRS